ncbi:hypothetical protein VIGAN_02173900, partial [Vigna angularis var. angularis]
MSFILQGNTFIHKGDVVIEEGEEDALMPDVADIFGPLRTHEDSSSFMEENIVTLPRRMEEMYNLQPQGIKNCFLFMVFNMTKCV